VTFQNRKQERQKQMSKTNTKIKAATKPTKPRSAKRIWNIAKHRRQKISKSARKEYEMILRGLGLK
jgi:hypothetical protein